MREDQRVTVVLTSLNETALLERAMGRIRGRLTEAGWETGFILVDDGSRPSERESLARLESEEDGIRVIIHERNMGRGRSVSDGLSRARTPFAGYIDPDLEIPESAVPDLLALLIGGADLAVGARTYPPALARPFRGILTRGYNLLCRILLSPPISDTAAGIKFFRTRILSELLPRVESEGWFWDTEVVVRAEDLGYDVREAEVPFRPSDEHASTVMTIPAIVECLRGVFRLMRRPNR